MLPDLKSPFNKSSSLSIACQGNRTTVDKKGIRILSVKYEKKQFENKSFLYHRLISITEYLTTNHYELSAERY